jgi:hypothetical protein
MSGIGYMHVSKYMYDFKSLTSSLGLPPTVMLVGVVFTCYFLPFMGYNTVGNIFKYFCRMPKNGQKTLYKFSNFFIFEIIFIFEIFYFLFSKFFISKFFIFKFFIFKFFISKFFIFKFFLFSNFFSKYTFSVKTRSEAEQTGIARGSWTNLILKSNKTKKIPFLGVFHSTVPPQAGAGRTS